jgi:tetratricopeptide (TPR) repeat protein
MISRTLRVRLLGAALAPAVSLACARSGAAPEPVAPVHGAALDPAVRALVDEHLGPARARPDDARLHATLGLVYEANTMWPEAEQSFANAARLAPEEPLWRLHRAIALAQLGEDERALELLSAVGAELPGSAAVQQRLGEALLRSGALAESHERFSATTRLEPDRPEGWVGLGAVELARGKAGAAARALERAVGLDPAYRRAHYLLGCAYREQGREEAARRELALGLEGGVRYLLDPLAAELRRYAVASTTRERLAQEFIEAGRAQRAVPILEELRDLHPQDITILNNLAVALQQLGEKERAHQVLLEALRLDETEVSTWINLAACLLDQGMISLAAEHAERAVRLAPDLAKTHLIRARVLARQERLEEAAAELATCLELDPRGAEALRLAGDTALELGNDAQAREHFDALARLRPLDAFAQLGLAEAALRAGDRQAAGRALSTAQRLNPDLPEVRELAQRLEGP